MSEYRERLGEDPKETSRIDLEASEKKAEEVNHVFFFIISRCLKCGCRFFIRRLG